MRIAFHGGWENGCSVVFAPEFQTKSADLVHLENNRVGQGDVHLPEPAPFGVPTSRPPGLRIQKIQRRKDEIITVAARLMREKGYGGVSIDEIGAAAKITGPAIYKYFDSKAAILAAILTRGVATAREMLSAVDVDRLGPVEALKQRIHVYIKYAEMDRDGMVVSVREANHVPAPYFEIFRQQQREIREENVRILMMARPELSLADARFMLTNVLQGLISASAYLYPIDTEARRQMFFRMAFAALMS
nr:TetR/AcrR family transcriptional regulator [Polymorphobacter sp.]